MISKKKQISLDVKFRQVHKDCPEEVLHLLKSQKAIFSKPANAEQIEKLEQHFKRRIPFELESLLKASNGIVGAGNEKFLWSVDEIIEINTRLRTESEFTEHFSPFDKYLYFSGTTENFLFGYPYYGSSNYLDLPDSTSLMGLEVYAWRRKTDSRSSMWCMSQFFKKLLVKEESPLKVKFEWFHETFDSMKYVKSDGLVTVKKRLESGDIDLNPPATEEQISATEKEIGMRLPEQLREFYKFSNGLDIYVYPLEELIHRDKEQRESWTYSMPFDEIFFFGAEGNGDAYFFRKIQGKLDDAVFEWDHECDERTWEGSNLFEFLNYMLEVSHDLGLDDEED